MPSDITQVVTPAVNEMLRDGGLVHLLLLARMPDGKFTWESNSSMTVGDARQLCLELLELLDKPRSRTRSRRGCRR